MDDGFDRGRLGIPIHRILDGPVNWLLSIGYRPGIQPPLLNPWFLSLDGGSWTVWNSDRTGAPLGRIIICTLNFRAGTYSLILPVSIGFSTFIFFLGVGSWAGETRSRTVDGVELGAGGSWRRGVGFRGMKADHLVSFVCFCSCSCSYSCALYWLGSARLLLTRMVRPGHPHPGSFHWDLFWIGDCLGLAGLDLLGWIRSLTLGDFR